ncbi:hypothetical protein [Aeromicrobium sp. Root236]|uniref:hypothetical protein n=1 Tax=Aeromicrobium sp. Root236 TaxID=1736498 RepID=UPI0012FCF026|nr:hypothetical protein [Aeromicrobium sp. Root236]
MATHADWVELRVHGVSGTPPEAMLAKPHVLQVDGDDKSRFFRAVDDDGREIRAADGHVVEGFHWGNYTSGSWRKALWLALIPFGLINAAAFMLPPVEDDQGKVDPLARRLRIGAMAGLRLQAVFLTVTFAFAIGMVLIDIIGTRWAYRHLSAIPDGFENLVPAAAAVLAALMILPLGSSLRPGPLIDGPPARPGPDPALQPVDAPSRPAAKVEHVQRRTPFARPEFYRGDSDTSAFRALHVAIGLFTIALMAQRFSARQLWSVDASEGRPGLGVVILVLLGIAIAATVSLGDPERGATTLHGGASRGWALTWHRWISRLSLVLLLLSMLSVGLAARALQLRGLPRERALDGLDRFRIPQFLSRVVEFDVIGRWLVMLAAVAALVAGLFAVGLALRARRWRARPDEDAWAFRPYSWGLTSIAVANLAVILGVGFSAALVTGVSTALGQREVKAGGDSKKTALGSTPLIDRVAYAWGLGIIVVALAAAICLLVSRIASRRRLLAHVDVGYPSGRVFEGRREDAEPYPAPRAAGWRHALSSAVWRARLKNQIQLIIWSVVLVGAVLALFLGWSELAALKHVARPPEDLRVLSVASDEVNELPNRVESWAPVLAQVGAWTLLGLIALLIAKGRQALGDEQTRRGINIVWDVVAFWPHAVHPFAPEPYSQRAVVDLTERIRYHVATAPEDAPGRSVIVCGHSQGSLVSFAALNLLSDEELSRIGLLTFGSQLRVIFPRAFPAYVNHTAIVSTRGLLGDAWINLWRDTDPLAGPVLSWNHDIHVTPPRESHFEVPAGRLEPIDGSIPAIDQVDDITAAFAVWRCGDDWRLTDPTRRPVELPPGVDPIVEAPINALRGHGRYWSDPAWAAALTTLRHRESGGADAQA